MYYSHIISKRFYQGGGNVLNNGSVNHKLFQRLPTNPRDTNDHLQLNVSEHMVECFGRCVPTMPDSTVDTIGYLL